jgi:mitotic spindle assembly checkpoint protein MAD1
MSSPATKRARLSTSRTSLSGRTSQGASSALPRPASQINVSRLASTQPSYDFIGGGDTENAPPQRRRSLLRQPSIGRLADNAPDENFRVKLNTLEYEVKNLRQEKEYLALQHQKELRDLQQKADADFKKYQSANSTANKSGHRFESLQKELRDAQDSHVNEKTALERKIRELEDSNSLLKEEALDAQSRASDANRRFQHQIKDADSARESLQKAAEDARNELTQVSQEMQSAQARIQQQNTELEELRDQNLELKSQTGGNGTLSAIQFQLTEQVAHIRQLETTNREQVTELRRLREAHRSIQIVEEQKKGLETELTVLKDVERQLSEALIQKEILQDEKRQWTTLLEDEEDSSPEAIVRTLAQTRIQLASLSERMGAVEAEASEKDELIRGLEAEKMSLATEIQKAASVTASDPGSDQKAYKRLERQKNLAVKEVEYLRAQIKSLDAEETMALDGQAFDRQRVSQIKELEGLVDEYRTEISNLHANMAKLESTPPVEPRGTKRPAESLEPDEENSQLGPLLRKNKNLQVALQKTAQQSKMLAMELQAAKAQLKGLRESKRVLEMKDNPTAQAEAIKMSALRTLKEENRNLLAQLRGEDLQGVKVVPVSTVDALQLDLKEMEKVVAEKEKRMMRQRTIWQDKAAEFRDVIASVLGWNINFLPNGKAKVSSMFHGRPDVDEDDRQYIIFDGENGTMKISGGTDGPFAKEIKQQVDFWVKGKKEIPCFLAALTIQFQEEYRSV